MIVLAARPAIGKALALDTPLRHARPGWTTMGEVQVGDLVMAADGTPTRVVAATDVLVDRPMLQRDFRDGSRDRGRRPAPVGDEHPRRAPPQRPACSAVRTSRRRSTRPSGAPRPTRAPTTPSRQPRPLQLPEADLPIDAVRAGRVARRRHSAAARSPAPTPRSRYIEADGLVVACHWRTVRYRCGCPARAWRCRERCCLMCGGSFVPKRSQVQTCGRPAAARSRRSPAR